MVPAQLPVYIWLSLIIVTPSPGPPLLDASRGFVCDRRSPQLLLLPSRPSVPSTWGPRGFAISRFALSPSPSSTAELFPKPSLRIADVADDHPFPVQLAVGETGKCVSDASVGSFLAALFKKNAGEGRACSADGILLLPRKPLSKSRVNCRSGIYHAFLMAFPLMAHVRVVPRLQGLALTALQ